MTAKQHREFCGRVEITVLSRASINADPRIRAELLGHPIYGIPPLRPSIVQSVRVCFEALHHSVYFDTEKYLGSYPWRLFNVMMIEWRGTVAQRVSVGRVHIGAFLSANPIRKHIHL
ncbi:hypothetical protein GQ44DRAFT_707634 [Phaeosphaeriaceae sp. PMI808]|nr:hypothetical protein GQ44DRAFT_707634 [Phaeosphaeriaceae sp. PMI808]